MKKLEDSLFHEQSIDYEKIKEGEKVNNNLRKERSMKSLAQKIVKAMLFAMVLISVMGNNVLTLSASGPTGHDAEVRGRVTELDLTTIEDGDVIDVYFDFYIGPDWQGLHSANPSIQFDPTLFEYVDAVSISESYFILMPMEIAPGVINILVASMTIPAAPADAEGFVVTVQVTMRVLDAQRIIDAGVAGHLISLSMFNDDINFIMADGSLLCYQQVADGTITLPMTVTTTDMKVVIPVTVNVDNATVEKGKTHQFAATVTGATDTTVTWSVSGATSTDTKIDPTTGLLTVAADETSTALTVVARSNEDTTKIAIAAVTVINPVIVTPQPQPQPSPGWTPSPTIPNTGVAGSVLSWVGVMAVTAGAASFLLKKKEEE